MIVKFCRAKGQIVLFSSLVIILLLTMSAALAGSAMAQEASVPNKTVAADGKVDINIAGASGKAVDVSGDIDGWTIESADPGPGLTVLPQVDSVPATWNTSEDGDTWTNLNGGSWNLTISPPADASPGEEYKFKSSIGGSNNTVDTDKFTLTVHTNSKADDSDTSGGDTGSSEVNDSDTSDGDTGSSDANDSDTSGGDTGSSEVNDSDTSDGDTDNQSTDDSTPGFNITTALVAFICVYLISYRVLFVISQ